MLSENESTGYSNACSSQRPFRSFCIKLGIGEFNLIPPNIAHEQFHRGLIDCESVAAIFSAINRLKTFVVQVPTAPLNNYLDVDNEFALNIEAHICEGNSTTSMASSGHSEHLERRLDAMQLQLEGLATFRNRPRRMKALPFSNEKNCPRTWLNTFEQCCRANQIAGDDEKIDAMAECMIGQELKWYQERIDMKLPDDWNTWRSVFIAAFSENELEMLRRPIFYRYKSGSLLEYYYEKVRLLNSAYHQLHERDLVRMVLQSLPEHLQQAALLNMPTTREQLKTLLAQLQPIIDPIKRETRPNETTKRKTSPALTQKSKPVSINQVEIVKDEPVYDHDEFDSDESYESDVGEINACSNTELLSSSNSFLLNVNGSNINVKFDSEADRTIISSGLVDYFNFETHPVSTRLCSYEGRVTTHSRAARLTLNLNGIIVVTEAIVSEDKRHQLLICCKDLGKLGIVWDFTNDKKSYYSSDGDSCRRRSHSTLRCSTDARKHLRCDKIPYYTSLFQESSDGGVRQWSLFGTSNNFSSSIKMSSNR